MAEAYLPFFIFLITIFIGISLFDLIQRMKKGDQKSEFTLVTKEKRRTCRVYENSDRDGKGELATFHKFISDYMDGKGGGVVYFPSAIVEFENGALETVPVNHIMMEKD